jgi:EIN3-binding F-box protein
VLLGGIRASEIKRVVPPVPDLNQVFLAEDEDEDSGLSAVARGCSSLRSLALWDVPHVTDAGLAGSGSSRRRRARARAGALQGPDCF